MTMPTKPIPHSPPVTRSTPPRLPIRPLLLACMLAGGNAMADGGKLVVELQNVRDSVGNIRASLYREPDSFRKEDKAFKVVSLPSKPGTLTLSFDGLAPGRYAVMVYHDANDDQKLNLRFGMFPTEGYGLSNNPKVMGPPKFEDSAFDFRLPETKISVKIAY
jgi:uncharacterized protein (DUF2141 family)